MSQGPVGQVGVPGSGHGYQPEKGAVSILRGSMNFHVLVTLESGVCVCAHAIALVTFNLDQPTKRQLTIRTCVYVSTAFGCC